MNEKQIRALAKRNAAKALKAEKQPKKSYDATIDATRPAADTTADADRIFKEMKKREF
jgi:hypothetical protein